MLGELGPAARWAAADRQRKPHLAGRPGRARLDAVEQVRRGLPGAPVLRRLRGGRPGRGARHRPRKGTVRRRTCQHAAALRRQCQPGRLRGLHCSGRHRTRHVPAPRRPPDPRIQGQLLRQVVRHSYLRCRRGDRTDRLRPGPRHRRRASAQVDHLRCYGLSAADRLRRLPRDCRRGRRDPHGRCRSFHRAWSQGEPSPARCRTPTWSR